MLVGSNIFITFAWYGHFKNHTTIPLLFVILVSWGIAFFEYLLQVPANRIGFVGNGGPFNLFQLKMIQEVVSLIVFTVFAVYVFKSDKFA